MQSEKEIVGTLRGFDEFVNMVLDDVTEYEYTAVGVKQVSKAAALNMSNITYDSFFSFFFYVLSLDSIRSNSSQWL